MPAPRTPMLIALPHGLGVSGVTMWGVRLANALVRRGRAAGLIVHPEPPGVAPIDLPIGAGVGVFRLPAGVPPIDECGGDLGPYLPWYRSAIGAMLDRAGAPVVLSPNLHGDCYGIGAALTREFGDRLRLVGWQHSDIAYDARVLEWFEPVLGAFVGVSDKITDRLRARLQRRAADVCAVPYGVDVAGFAPEGPATVARGDKVAPAAEESLVRVPGSSFAPKGHASITNRPLRLLYSGRIEHHQKRILALPILSRELTRRGVPHELTIVGDGPAAADLDAAIRDLPFIHRLGPASPLEVTRLLDEHDALVLASRYEGLSVSMLEAMARGCVPLVTRTESGALQAITDAENGLIADAGPEADEPAAAAALADAVERFLRLKSARPGALSDAALRTARERFSLEGHVERVEMMLDWVADSPARVWPADRVCAFTGLGGGGSGSVPPDGARRMADVLRELAGRKVVIHGTGRHTLELEQVIRHSPAEIVAFADDDRQKHGTRLWDRPVIAPGEAPATGATDVVISSWMHEEAIWARRTAYEAGRLLVRRIYT